MTEQFTVHFSEKLSRPQKIILILRDYPQIRDSYDLIAERYYATYDDKVKPSTLSRDIRIVQYDVGIYPPSEGVKRMRKMAQEQIIASQKKTVWGFIKSLFR